MRKRTGMWHLLGAVSTLFLLVAGSLWTANARIDVLGNLRSPRLAALKPLEAQGLGGGDLSLSGQLGGSIQRMATKGTLAFVGEGPVLQIVDLSDPDGPRALGRTAPFPELIRDVAISEDHAYVSVGHAGLRVVDVSDALRPVEVAAATGLGRAAGISIAGELAFVTAGESGLRVLDISVPGNPLEVGSAAIEGDATAVAVAGGHAFVAARAGGLRIVDVSDPSNAREVASLATPKAALDVALEGSVAYVAAGDAGVLAADVSDPLAPLWTAQSDASARAVVVRNGSVFGADRWNGVGVLDVRQPNLPEVARHARTDTGAGPGAGDPVVAIATTETHLLVSYQRSGLQMLALSGSHQPLPLGSYDGLGSVRDVEIRGDVAHLATDSGLVVADVSAGQPEMLAVERLDSNARRLRVAADVAYLATGRGGLVLIDVSDPLAPRQKSTWSGVKDVVDVDVVNGLAFVAAGHAGLWILDVSDGSAAKLLGVAASRDYDSAVAVAGRYAYVAAEDGGLRVVDIGDPAHPFEVAARPTPGGATDVIVAGDYAYVAAGSAGLRIIDVSNPLAPSDVAAYDQVFAASLTLAGDYVYVASERSGVRVIDVSDPRAPVGVSNFDTWGSARGVAASEGRVYVADSEAGLVILSSLPL